jgi:hypothetical protein
MASAIVLNPKATARAAKAANTIVVGVGKVGNTLLDGVRAMVPAMLELRLCFVDTKTKQPDVRATSQAYRDYVREHVTDPVRVASLDDDGNDNRYDPEYILKELRKATAAAVPEWIRGLIKAGTITQDTGDAILNPPKAKTTKPKVDALTQVGKDLRAAVTASRTKDADGNRSLDRVGMLGVMQQLASQVAASLTGDTIKVASGELDRITTSVEQVREHLDAITRTTGSLKAAATKARKPRKAATPKAA